MARLRSQYHVRPHVTYLAQRPHGELLQYLPYFFSVMKLFHYLIMIAGAIAVTSSRMAQHQPMLQPVQQQQPVQEILDSPPLAASSHLPDESNFQASGGPHNITKNPSMQI